MTRMSIQEYRKQNIPTEEEDQVALAQILDQAGILYCHVPNGGKRHIGTALKMKRAGVKPGVPDILIFDPPPNFPEFVGAALELKRTKGGQLSEAQERWIKALARRKWAFAIRHGLDEALEALRGWGYIK